jgi:aminoglycoside phosphotransferase (APT) family kinase protein
VVAHLERNPRPDDPLRRALDGAGLICASPDDSARRALGGTDFAGAIEEAIARATAGLSAEEIEPLPRAAWRLNSGDFCVVNLLVDGEEVAVVDWEWAGWDDPANLAVGFLRHAGTEGLRPEAGTAFLEAYCAARGLPEEERVRFGQVARLQNAFWLAALAFAAAPETLAARRATVPDFDESAHVANIATRLRARLEAIARR